MSEKHKLPQKEALDALIGSFQDKLTSLKGQQQELASTSNAESPLGMLGSDPSKTYIQIEETLKTALEILELAKLNLEAAPDPESFSSVGSILASIAPLFKEFTSIWNKQLNFQNSVMLENLKLKNKKELEDHKMKLKLQYYNDTNSGNASNNEVVPFNTKDFIDALDV